LKREIYENDPQSIEEIMHNVTRPIKKVSKSTLVSVSKEMTKRAEFCLKQNGGLFEHFLK